MESLEFNYMGVRAQKARLSIHLGGRLRTLIAVLSWSLLVCGLVIVFVAAWSFGWLIAGLSAVGYMVVKWYDGELKRLVPAEGDSIDALLEGTLLGRLPREPTELDVANALFYSAGAHFIGARFGVRPRFISDLVSTGTIPLAAAWQEALRIKSQTNSELVSSSIMAVALVRSYPEFEQILAQVYLSEGDLIEGVHWRNHVMGLIEKFNIPMRTGGVARDWSFGYIPLLMRFGRNISQQMSGNRSMTVSVASHVDAVDQLVSTFAGGGSHNAVLVGAAGVGKTTIIRAFAERLINAAAGVPSELRYRQVFMLDSSALIAAAPGRGELENLIMRVLSEAYSAKNIIVCLDNAQLFFEEGIGAVNLTNVLQPILDAGNVKMVLSMDEQHYLKIGQNNPSLLNTLNRINIAPASEADTIRVLQEQIIFTESRHKVTYTYQALKEAYRLSERYVHDLAMPGKAVKLMESAAKFAEKGFVTINSVQQAIESTLDVKVSVATEYDDRDKLLNLENLIHQRMINQKRAVGVVSDALRRARAGVRNQDRPIGTFLFLGPTGVGKTELSKALADVYFGGESKIIRLDLNEFVRPDDVARLIADGASDSNSLTAQVMKQPFSVVLLDEIEKAAPEVLVTLLQLLDEGILRDVKNREVSFRDAIVIATSNAGSNRIREYVDRGYDVAQFETQFTNELVSSNQFRPEFLNRFDEIVVFTPLTKEDLLKIVDLMIAGVNKTLEAQKVSVIVESDAKQVLVDRGYDPRLGARPIRRVVQKAVENTVAKAMLSGELSTGGQITVTHEQVEQILGAQQQAQSIIQTHK